MNRQLPVWEQVFFDVNSEWLATQRRCGPSEAPDNTGYQAILGTGAGTGCNTGTNRLLIR